MHSLNRIPPTHPPSPLTAGEQKTSFQPSIPKQSVLFLNNWRKQKSCGIWEWWDYVMAGMPPGGDEGREDTRQAIYEHSCWTWLSIPPFTEEQTVLSHSWMSRPYGTFHMPCHPEGSISTSHPSHIHNHYWVHVSPRLSITVHEELYATALTASQEFKKVFRLVYTAEAKSTLI